MESYRELDVWIVGMKLVKEIYRIAGMLPREELYGGSSQIKDAAKSILANVAEGCGRYTYKDKAGKFVISRGECFEVEAFLYIFVELGFVRQIDTELALDLVQQEKKILSGLIGTCRRRQKATVNG